ncbi:hypothetical protein AAVH_14002 [Aphelenchoides avenae]|nr:hypothetical protein AAVH_14002 [Aphelenchus avenae]
MSLIAMDVHNKQAGNGLGQSSTMNNSKDSEGPPPRTHVSPFVLASPRASDAELFSIRPLANFHGNQEVNEDEDTNVAEVARYNPIRDVTECRGPYSRLPKNVHVAAEHRLCHWPDAVQEDPDEMAQTEADVRPAKTTLTEEVDPRVNDPEFTDEPACNSLNAEALPSPMEPIHSGLRSRQNQMFVMVAPNEVPMDCLFDVVLAEVSDYERWIMCYALPLGLYTTRVDGSPPRWRILEHWPNVDEVAQEHKMRQYKLRKPPVPTVVIDRFAFHQFIVSRQPALVRGGENSEEAPPATDSEMARQLEREFGLNGASRLIPMNLGGHFPAYLRLSPGQPPHRLAQNSSHASSANSNRSSSAAKATSGTRLNRQRSETRGRPGRQQQAQHSRPVQNSYTSAEARPVHQPQLYPRQPTSQPSHSRQDANAIHPKSHRSGQPRPLMSLDNATVSDNRSRALVPQQQTSSAAGGQARGGDRRTRQTQSSRQPVRQRSQSSRLNPIENASRDGVLAGPVRRTTDRARLSKPSLAQEHLGRVVAPNRRSYTNENRYRGGAAAPRAQPPEGPWLTSARQRSQSLQRTATENNNQHKRPITSVHGTDADSRNADLLWQPVRERSYGPRPAASGSDTGRAPAPARCAAEARPLPTSNAASRGMRRYEETQSRMSRPPRGMHNHYRPKRISADSGFDAYEEWAS